jgi:hypothetical protein
LAVNKSNCLIPSFRGNREHSVRPAGLLRTHNATSQFHPSKKGSNRKEFRSFLLQICNIVFFFYIIQASLCCLRAIQQINISFARRSSRSVSRFLSFLHSGENPPHFLFFFFFFSQVEIISPSLVYIYIFCVYISRI